MELALEACTSSAVLYSAVLGAIRARNVYARKASTSGHQ
jgi:hypothetical protein